jgi:hypothetical protein
MKSVSAKKIGECWTIIPHLWSENDGTPLFMEPESKLRDTLFHHNTLTEKTAEKGCSPHALSSS